MAISNEVLAELLKGCKRPEGLCGDAGLMKEPKVRLMERMPGAGLTAHLGYETGAEPPPGQTNRRNGLAPKRVKGSDGEAALSVPRDREGRFEPGPVKKGQTRIDGMDDRIAGLCAAGLGTRDIQTHLEDAYGLRVSPELIGRVADAVPGEVREWQHRAPERIYPIVIFDALRVKIRDADSRMVKSEPLMRHWFEHNGERRLHRPGRHPRRRSRGSGPVDRRKRRRQVPALGDERAQEPRRAGYSGRGRGRAEGLCRGHRRLPRSHGQSGALPVRG